MQRRPDATGVCKVLLVEVTGAHFIECSVLGYELEAATSQEGLGKQGRDVWKVEREKEMKALKGVGVGQYQGTRGNVGTNGVNGI